MIDLVLMGTPFSASKALSSMLSHLNLMPIVQNKYSHSHFVSGKTEVGAVNSLPKVSQQVAEAEFEFGSSDNMTLPLGKKFKNKREQW